MSKKPTWAGSPTFGSAWCAVESAAGWIREVAYSQLSMARVITIPPVQFAALPPFADSIDASVDPVIDTLAHEPLPFDPLYIDLGGRTGRSGWNHELGLVLSKSIVPANMVSGELLESTQVLVFYGIESGPQLLPVISTQGMNAGQRDWAFITSPDIPIGSEIASAARASAWRASDVAARALMFINSYNVDLGPAPMPRGERRQAQRKGHSVAQTVVVRPPKRRTTAVSEPDGRNFSHRFERRGHYKHFPAGTRLADAAPEKLSWSTERGEYVRRLWCPPHVVGPADKPFIPKVRRMAEKDAA